MLGISENEITALVSKIDNDGVILVNTIPIVWKSYINRSPLYKEEFIFHFVLERKHILCYLSRAPFNDNNPVGRDLHLSDVKLNNFLANPLQLIKSPSLEQFNNFLSTYWNFDVPSGFDLIDYGIEEKYKNEFERSDTFNSLLERYSNCIVDNMRIEKTIEKESLELVSEFESLKSQYQNNNNNYESAFAHKEYLKQLKLSYLKTHDQKYRDNLAKKHPAWIITYEIHISSFIDYVWQVEDDCYILNCKLRIEELFRLKVFYYIGGVNFIVRTIDGKFDFSCADWDLSSERLYLYFHSDKLSMQRFISLLHN